MLPRARAVRGSPRKGAPSDLGTHQGCVGGAKGQGGPLGNPHNLAEAGKLGRNVQIIVADEFTTNVLPVVDALRKAGADTLEAISCGLNRQGIRTPRGKRWYASSVFNLLARTNRLGEVR
jgi:hypothetical protein